MLIGHRNPTEMAERLVTYMSDARKVLAEIKAEFPETSMTVRSVIELSDRHKRRVALLERGPKVSRDTVSIKEDPLPNNVIEGSGKLHKALWKHHPRIMRELGAVPC